MGFVLGIVYHVYRGYPVCLLGYCSGLGRNAGCVDVWCMVVAGLGLGLGLGRQV